MEFQRLLRFAVEHDASDVHIQAGLAPSVRIGGIIRHTDQPPISDEAARAFIKSIAPLRFQEDFDERIVRGMDFSYSIAGFARFRCSAYSHLSTAGIVMRIIKSRIPSVAELHLPGVINDIALAQHGLTLVTGTTGSGKSTTLAAMIDLINQTRPCKIVAIEDPVEYMHTPKHALIAQLEVGSDTPSFEQALRQTLRQDPDVVLVGELRDMDTLRIALRAADTGHQVLSTVHSASAPQTIERIIAMFPPNEHKLLLTQLAGNLEAIISQRLIICRDGSRRPAAEVLRGGPVPSKYILEGRALELSDYMRTAGAGQQTFDQDLLALYRSELISQQEAIRNATNREQLTMAMRGISNSRNLQEPGRAATGAGAGQFKPVVQKVATGHGSGDGAAAPNVDVQNGKHVAPAAPKPNHSHH
jgi:twitching motility protein PilT